MSKICVLGTGTMGAPIVRRLLAAGHEVAVWNRNASRAEPLVHAGAHAGRTPAEAAEGADITITMLTDAGAVETVLFGPDGAAPALREGAIVVQMSTIGPAAVRALAGRLPAGIEFIDAPVGGSVGAATTGTLTLLVGGEAAVIERVTPVLDVLGSVRRCGGIGEGSALKLVLNTALITGLAALADTLAVADAVGVDRGLALEALAGGALGGAIGRATAKGGSFAIALAAKDLDLAIGELGEPGEPGRAPAPVLRAVAPALHDAPDQTADLATITTPPTKEHM